MGGEGEEAAAAAAVAAFHVAKKGVACTVGRYWNWQTPLFAAANYGDEQTIRMLLEVGRVDVNGVGTKSSGATALLQAAYMGHTEVVRLLVGGGEAGVDKVNNKGCTPHFMAALGNNIETARYLLSKGADRTIETRNPGGYTALSIAEQTGHTSKTDEQRLAAGPARSSGANLMSAIHLTIY